MKYEKFEEWMIGKKVTHVYAESSGVIVERPDEDDPDICVRVKYDEGGLTGDTLGAFLRNLEFLEEKPSEEVGAQENSQINWEGSQIDWHVGQVVWCTVLGKGIIKEIESDPHYPVQVHFDGGSQQEYTLEGKMYYYSTNNRTLFFSEPVITAELFPPKKPFVPTLKEGDKVVLTDRVADYLAEVVREEENHIYYKTEDGVVTFVDKNLVKVFKLGEEIKFQ